MTVPTSVQTLRRALYDEVPGLGFFGVASSVTTTTLTDSVLLRDLTVSPNHYRGFYLYRPTSVADKIRRILQHDPNTGTLTISGTPYSDTSELNYEIVGLVYPDELNACIRRAQTRIYFETMTPLTLIEDGDLDSPTTAAWTPSLCTLSKDSTSTRNFSGIRAMRVLNTGVNGYAESQSVLVQPNDQLFFSAVVQCQKGSAGVVIRDQTNGIIIAASPYTSNKAFTYIWGRVVVPQTCKEIRVRLLGTDSDADVYWSHVVLYRMGQSILPAPSWLDDPFKLLKLREARYKSTNPADATSRQFSDWIQPNMYELLPLHLEANPYQIQVYRPIPFNELWLHGKRPFSDLQDLDSDTSTTLAPVRLIMAYAKQELAQILVKRYPQDTRWQTLLVEATREVEAESVSRPELPIQPIRREEFWRI